MSARPLLPGLYTLSLGVVNAYLLEDESGLVLIDTGLPGNEEKILNAVRRLGRSPEDIRHIVLTHLHADHTGSLAALKRRTGALAYMHAADAELTRMGLSMREVRPGPGMLHRPFFRLPFRFSATVEPTEIEYEIRDGDELPFAGGLRAIHTPGHSRGHLAFLWPRHGGVLFAADAASRFLGRLGYSLLYEDLEEGKRSLEALAALDFSVATFGHGRAIRRGASGHFHRLRSRGTQ